MLSLFTGLKTNQGPLPPSLFALPSLEALLLDDNAFSGPMPPLAPATALSIRALVLADNNLSGPLSMKGGGNLGGNKKDALEKLEVLGLEGNAFEGEFPAATLAKLPKLQCVSVRSFLILSFYIQCCIHIVEDKIRR
jgi:hypothetical protein